MPKFSFQMKILLIEIQLNSLHAALRIACILGQEVIHLYLLSKCNYNYNMLMVQTIKKKLQHIHLPYIIIVETQNFQI